ncbi:CinA family protein [Solwaraspora sp. WMMB762]|uniref:CinA family protein n=1 Tax=Solwaraspora sp. WMMB762 TaxID=3404120 RepID=UPI003B957612
MLPEEALAKLLKQSNLTLATAESLTGGLVGELITSVPGASSFYLGGMITYATESKSEVLGVDRDTIREEGPVSCNTARQMAARIREKFGSSIGLATTGVAGPTMQDGHPVGTLHIGFADSVGDQCISLRSSLSDRVAIRNWAAREALTVVVNKLASP